LTPAARPPNNLEVTSGLESGPRAAGLAAVASPTALQSGVPALVAAALGFGVMALSVRIAAESMPAPQIAFIRFTGSLSLLLLLAGREAVVPRSATYGRLVLRGLLGAAGITLQFVAIARAGAGTATMLHSTYPILTGLLAIPLLGERLTLRTAAALVLAVAGIAVVVGPASGPTSDLASGAAAGLLGSCFAAGAIIAARHLRRIESASLITTWFMAVGMLLTAPAILGGLPAFTPALAATLAVTIVSSLAGQWLMHSALGRVEAARAGLFLMGNVVAATLLEAAWFAEPVALHRVLGGAIVVAAVWLSTSSAGREP
jgi:drug/metabolite transporter (DMT)-like permease